jgi:hypothetical protein
MKQDADLSTPVEMTSADRGCVTWISPNWPRNCEAFWSGSRGWARKSGARTAYVSHHFKDKYAVPASSSAKAAGYGIGIPTEPELTFVNNHFPLIFLASPSRSTWLFAVQLGRPVAEFTDTSK